MKKILGAAVAASMLVVGSANAAISNGYSQSYGQDSEIVLAMWDSVAKRSVLVDTGMSYLDIVNGVDQSINVSAALNAAFGSNLSNVRWNAAGYSNQSYDINDPEYPVDFTLNGAIFTGSAGVVYSPSNADIPNAQTSFTGLLARTGESLEGDGYWSDQAAYEAARDINNYYVALTDTDVIYLDNALWGNTAGSAGWNTTLVGSGSLQTYWNHFNLDGSAVSLEQLGLFTLDLATGTFTYDAGTTEVPVPAAAWLLVSGLAGLGTVARRRKQA